MHGGADPDPLAARGLDEAVEALAVLLLDASAAPLGCSFQKTSTTRPEGCVVFYQATSQTTLFSCLFVFRAHSPE